VLEAGLLSTVYETPVRVGILRGEEHLSVLPPGQDNPLVWQPEKLSSGEAAMVHVIAGGGSGELMMRALADADITFSAGPLNAGDSDYTLAQRLAASCIVEPPYAPVSADGLAAAHLRVMDARAIILCPTPLGRGNIMLIEEALAARRSGLKVILLEPTATSVRDSDVLLAGVRARDFTTRGAELYRELLASDCLVATSVADALRLLG
jgi:iron complex transport system ATP-binding protein